VIAFSDFTYPEVATTFGLVERTVPSLFANVSAAAVSPELVTTLRRNARLPLVINTEKAQAEWLIAPILVEFWDRYAGTLTLLSGTSFATDPAGGLIGYVDFLFGRGPQRPLITAPVLVVFEAKNENIDEALGQCIAAMVGAQRFNRRHNTGIETVYGCSTTGDNWKFLQLTDTLVTIDLTEYQLAEGDKILDILIHMVGPVLEPAAA
jgi:hypothetical protein